VSAPGKGASAALIAGVFLGGVAFGLLTRSLIVSERGAQPGSALPVANAAAPYSPAGSGSAEETELVGVLRELGGAVALLSAQLAEPLPSTPSARAPLEGTALPSSESLEDLSAALLELSRSLAHLPRSAGQGVDAPVVVANEHTRTINLERLRLPPGAYQNDELYDPALRRMFEEHVGWSPGRLLATYGAPKRVSAYDDGRERWIFEVRLGEGWTEEYEFYVRNERVIQVGVDYEMPDD